MDRRNFVRMFGAGGLALAGGAAVAEGVKPKKGTTQVHRLSFNTKELVPKMSTRTHDFCEACITSFEAESNVRGVMSIIKRTEHVVVGHQNVNTHSVVRQRINGKWKKDISILGFGLAFGGSTFDVSFVPDDPKAKVRFSAICTYEMTHYRYNNDPFSRPQVTRKMLCLPFTSRVVEEMSVGMAEWIGALGVLDTPIKPMPSLAKWRPSLPRGSYRKNPVFVAKKSFRKKTVSEIVDNYIGL